MINKPIEVYMTSVVSANEIDNFALTTCLIKESLKILNNHFVDMLVLEKTDKNTIPRSAGYFFDNQSKLDETTTFPVINCTITETIWLKIDDYGDKYIATFLYPSDY